MSPTESCRLALQRIRDANGELRAFVHIADDRLIEAARAQEGRHDLPLAGMAIGVKDIIDTADMPTAYGSRHYVGHRPASDAAIVALLRAAGALVVGKTATTEFATWPPTATRNPRQAEHTPGGSSAGSAAAVAAGLVPVALGTQTLGSVIRPASYCGVVGFKPTFGRFPRAGVKALAESLDTVGLLASGVDEAARVYGALVAGEDMEKPPTAPRFAFVRGPHWEAASVDARAALESAVADLRAIGLPVSEAEIHPDFAAVTAAARTIHDYEMRRSLMPEYLAGRGQIDASLAAGIERAARWSAGDHRRALQCIEEHRRRFSRFMESFDAVISLAATGEAPRGLGSTGDPIMNAAWTALHAPCLTLPLLRGATGLPIGLQLVGDRFKDSQLLGLGAWLTARI